MRAIVPVLLTAAAACAALAVNAAPESPWHTALSYDGGGVWQLRVPVTVTASVSEPLQGVPVHVVIRETDATAALIGQTVASLRVTASTGIEYLFDVTTAEGRPKHTGTLVPGDRLTLPVETDTAETGVVPIPTADAEVKDTVPEKPADPVRRTVSLLVYADNDDAWLPAEWLGGQLVNLGFEFGDEDPSGWIKSSTDSRHRMIRQKGGAYAGEYCARCEVDPGAEPTWVKYMQRRIPVSPGERYRFTGWVKADDVKGNVGWYVHVDGVRPQLVNRSEIWSGTFDWRRAVIEFEVPEGGRTFSCGTLLHGTGTAWFDEIRLERIGDESPLTVAVGSAQTLRLERLQPADDWPANGDWRWRTAVRARNVTDAPRESGS